MLASVNAFPVGLDSFVVDEHGRRIAHYVKRLACRLRDMGQFTQILNEDWI